MFFSSHTHQMFIYILIHERQVVSFEDLILDDVVAVVVRVSELLQFGSHEMRGWGLEDSAFSQRSVHGGLGGDDEPASSFHRVYLMNKGFDTLFVRESSFGSRQHALDATGEDGTVGLESLSLQRDLVHDDSLLEVDLVVGFQSSVILESGHTFLGVSFRHRFLEEVGETVGEVGEAFKSIAETGRESSPGHG